LQQGQKLIDLRNLLNRRVPLPQKELVFPFTRNAKSLYHAAVFSFFSPRPLPTIPADNPSAFPTIHGSGQTKKPLIGLTIDVVNTQENPDNTWYSEYTWYALGKRYSDSISRAGGVPILLCSDVQNTKTYANILDGLLITGVGSRIDPAFCAEPVDRRSKAANHEKTQFEFAITHSMIQQNKPILGINVGMHIINIIRDGTLAPCLHQYLPMHAASHAVRVLGSSMLHSLSTIAQGIRGACPESAENMVAPSNLADDFLVETNSYHNQAIGKLGKNLRVNAIAADGVVEGIEAVEPDVNFCIGVQWNAEFLINDLDYALFCAFVQKAGQTK
jgi:putative glutamine amidotransferase